MKNRIAWILILGLSLTSLGCEDEASGNEDETDTAEYDSDGAHSTDSGQESDNDQGTETASLCGTADAECQPGSFVECKDLGDPELLGHLPARCLADCTGYDTSLCLSPDEMVAYGDVSVELDYDFILDVNQIGNVDYQDAHLETIITETPVFTGTIGGSTFPGEEVADYEILVLRTASASGGELAITQQAFDESGNLVNPSMHLKLPGDHYSTGDAIEVCLGQQVIIYFYDLNPQTFDIDCFHGVTADGVLTVELAENLDLTDGGKLSLSSPAPIITYYMKNTPHGDLSENLDYPVCAKQEIGPNEGAK